MSFKYNPLTGKLDIVSPDNFSYNHIPLGITLLVPENQQMIVVGHLDVHGDLDLIGDLAII